MTFQWFSAAAAAAEEIKREKEEVKMLPKFVSFEERQSPIVSFAPRQTCSVPIIFWHPSPYIKSRKEGKFLRTITTLFLSLLRRNVVAMGNFFLFPSSTDFGYSINIHIESQALAAFRFALEFGVHVLQHPHSRPTRPIQSHQPNTIHLLPPYYRFVPRLLAFQEDCHQPRCG